MTETSKEFKKLRTEFNANLRRVSEHLAAARLFINDGDIARAYEEAQNIQDAAYDAKDLLTDLLKK